MSNNVSDRCPYELDGHHYNISNAYAAQVHAITSSHAFIPSYLCRGESGVAYLWRPQLCSYYLLQPSLKETGSVCAIMNGEDFSQF